ncbi:hypothetical protein ACJMK2_000370 [Sinanodonta woodiana]|uniref:Uncharacterized protein n=1 Tax=Sinanodonta woodiana TaxID=1069815 RepID=A0ABD3XQS6_SINWO
MKRKASELKNNPMYEAKKSKTLYFGDPYLIPRIRKYLADNKSKKNISIPVMADDLQMNYGGICFIIFKAFSVICAEEEDEDEEEDEEVDEVSAHEAKHLKQKHACKGNSSDSTDEEGSVSSGNLEYVQYEDTNQMNNMLSSLYKKTPQKADSGTEVGTNKHKLPDLSFVQEKSSPSSETVSLSLVSPKHSGEIRSCDVNFFIDRRERDILNNGNVASQYSPSAQPAEKQILHRYPKKDNSDESQLHNSNQNCRKLDADLELDISDKLDKDKLENAKKEQVSDKRLRKKSKRDKSSAKPEKKGVQTQNSTVTFADFGGNEVGLKEVCKLLLHLRYPKLYSQLGVTPPRGFLLHGPPGCGKTLLAHAIAGVDLGSSASSHVLVIGATNHPDSLDPALRRAGRFDREILLGIPDESARLRILKVLFRNLRLEAEFDFMYLAKNTPGFVGADLMALVREAGMTAVNRVFNELVTNHKNSGPEAVQMRTCNEEPSPMPIDSVSVDRKASEKKTKLSQDELELESVLTWLKEPHLLTDDQLEDLFILLEDFKASLWPNS